MELCIAFFPHTWEEQASHRTKQSPMNLEGEKKKNKQTEIVNSDIQLLVSSTELLVKSWMTVNCQWGLLSCSMIFGARRYFVRTKNYLNLLPGIFLISFP